MPISIRYFFTLILMLFPALCMASERFSVRVTISGLPTEAQRARLHYFLHSDANSSVADFIELVQQTSLNQFSHRFEGLRFPVGGNQGLVWGEIKDERGSVIMRIPVTQFTEARISQDSRRNILLEIRARPPGLDAFRESFPIPLPDKGMLSDETVGFYLETFRILIENEYVDGFNSWERIYHKFLENIEYFSVGNSEKIGKVLTFLESRYASDRHRAERQNHFVRFYARFLVSVLELDIGGRPAPRNETIQQYSIYNLRTIIANDPEFVLPEVFASMVWAESRGNPVTCLHIGATMQTALLGRSDLWENAVLDDDLELRIKRVLMKMVDCFQRHYADVAGGSRQAIRDGAIYLATSSSLDRDIMTRFVAMFERLEGLGRFPARQRGGQFQQIYDYYDVLQPHFGGLGG